MAESLNILVVRPDRIGDVVLSTPVLEVLRRHYPKAKITLLVRAPVAPLVRGLKSIDEVLIYEPEGRHGGIKGLFELIKDFREREFRIAVALQSEWKIAAALFGSGVRYRVGSLSKPHSYLFYNRGVRQRRSHVEMHETDYNLQLLRRLGVRVGTRNVLPQVALPSEAGARAAQWLETQGWGGDRRFVLVHSGMGGSALNWPEEYYIDLVRGLAREGISVLVTAGPAEIAVLERFKAKIKSDGRVLFWGGKDAGSIEDWAALADLAAVTVAPSTGPMHVAVALKRPVVTFFSPIRVQSAIRWGPYLSDETRASVLVPEVYCGQEFVCRGALCNYHPCMKSLTVNQAIKEVKKQLEKGSPA